MLLDAGVGINTTDDAGRTALHYAAELSGSDDPSDMRRPAQLKLIQLLIRRSANLNAIDKKGDTPLCRADGRDSAEGRCEDA
jgi:ankyrin repeat protein